MDQRIYNLHINAAKIAGKEKSCGKKVDYKSFETAQKSAEKMSVKYGKEMELYPCPFCNGWHIGRKMNEEELRYYAKLGRENKST